MKVCMLINGCGLSKKNKNSFIFVERQAMSLSGLGVSVYKLYSGSGSSFFYLPKTLIQLIRCVKDIKPEIIHAQYGSVTAILATIVSVICRTKLLISFCGSDLLGVYKDNRYLFIQSTISIYLSKMSAYCANAVIVKSKGLFDELPDKCKTKSRVIPNGVNLKIYKPIDIKDARKNLGINLSKKIILFYNGSGDPVKNPELVKKVVDILQDKRNDIKLLTVGNVSPDKMPLFLNAADVLIVTSFHEGSSNILKEALACNLPVVSVTCGDVIERLTDVYPSYVVEYKPDLIADAINKIFILGIRSNGRSKVDYLSEEIITSRVKELYDYIVLQDGADTFK